MRVRDLRNRPADYDPLTSASGGPDSFLEQDPPDHTRLRRLAAPAFRPKLIRGYRPQIEAVAHDLLDRAARRGSFDLIGDFAAPLPITVITKLLGIPDVDMDHFARIGAAIGQAFGGVSSARQAADLRAARDDRPDAADHTDPTSTPPPGGVGLSHLPDDDHHLDGAGGGDDDAEPVSPPAPTPEQRDHPREDHAEQHERHRELQRLEPDRGAADHPRVDQHADHGDDGQHRVRRREDQQRGRGAAVLAVSSNVHGDSVGWAPGPGSSAHSGQRRVDEHVGSGQGSSGLVVRRSTRPCREAHSSTASLADAGTSHHRVSHLVGSIAPPKQPNLAYLIRT
ncbi:MAG: hypothetical protein ACRDST_03955 [Pseudonocardiaceae bacterium]